METREPPLVLPYWVQDHIHGQTKFLIRAWLEWKSKDGFQPGTLYQVSAQRNLLFRMVEG